MRWSIRSPWLNAGGYPPVGSRPLIGSLRSACRVNLISENDGAMVRKTNHRLQRNHHTRYSGTCVVELRFSEHRTGALSPGECHDSRQECAGHLFSRPVPSSGTRKCAPPCHAPCGVRAKSTRRGPGRHAPRTGRDGPGPAAALWLARPWPEGRRARTPSRTSQSSRLALRFVYILSLTIARAVSPLVRATRARLTVWQSRGRGGPSRPNSSSGTARGRGGVARPR